MVNMMNNCCSFFHFDSVVILNVVCSTSVVACLTYPFFVFSTEQGDTCRHRGVVVGHGQRVASAALWRG
jgi:hypothetical protein